MLVRRFGMELVIHVVIFFCIVSGSTSEHVGNFHGDLRTQQGQAVYNVPIELPKGPNNIQPGLNLVYMSEGGNGPMGLGWSFDVVSVISRCPQTIAQDGQVRGVKYDADDRFCLDGQRLVVVDGTYGADGAEYKTEVDSYSKVVSSGQYGIGPASFTVWTKNGNILHYGTSTLGQIKGRGQISVHQWNLEQISDRSGNNVNITYIANSTALLALDYCTTSVAFKYTRRPDNTTTYFNGNILSNITERLSNIEVRNTALVRQYMLRYHDSGSGGSNQSLLTSIKLCDQAGICMQPLTFKYGSSDALIETFPAPHVAINDYFGSEWSMPENPRLVLDINGDGLADIIGFHGSCVKVALNGANGTFHPAQCWVTAFGYSLGWRAATHVRDIGDIDGDGLPDVVGFYSDGVYVSFNTGSSFKSPVKLLDAFSYNQLWRTATHLRFIQDVNGDGRADIVGFFNDGVHVALSKGRTFEPVGMWNSHFGSSTVAGGWNMVVNPRFLRDVNGDGLPDIVGFSSSGVRVALNTGSSFSTYGVWLDSFLNGYSTEYPRHVVDVNGDGLADIVGFEKHYVYISLSTGTSFASPTAPVKAFTYYSSPAYRVATHDRFVADVTGDGLPDIVGIWHGGVYISRNKGHGNFSSPTRWVNAFGYSRGWRKPAHPRHLVDVNGDGMTDIIGFNNSGVFISLNNNERPIIKQFVDGFDRIQSISYMTLPEALHSGHYEKPTGMAYPIQNPVPPIKVVTQLNRNKGTEAGNTTNYFYGGLAVDVSGRGGQGFRWEKEVGHNTRSVLIEHEQAFPFTGTTKRIKRTVPSEDGSWMTISDTVAMHEVITQFHVHSVMPTKEVVTSYELDGTEVSEVETTYEGTNGHGESLHVTSRTSGKGQTFIKRTMNVYSDDVSKWLVGQLISSKVTQEGPCVDPITRHVTYTYYADTGYLKSQTVEPGHELSLTTDYEYDQFGNVISKTDTPVQDKGMFRRITTMFDDNGIYVKMTSNGKGHTETYHYETSTGNLLTLTGGNGLMTNWTYDALGRKTGEFQSDGTEITWSYSWDGMMPGAKYNIEMVSEGSPKKTRVYDALDRIIREQSAGFDGSDVYEDLQYNKDGLLYRHSYPYFVSDKPTWTVYHYDVLGRISHREIPGSNGAVADHQTTYEGLTLTQVDGLEHATHKERDALGRLIKVTDHLGGMVQYKYDSVGNTVETVGVDGLVTSIEYDLMGRKTKVNEPNMGSWEYKHNAFGELILQKDAKQNVLSLEYDTLGRLVKRTELEGTTTWTFDSQPHGLGMLASVQGAAGYSRTWHYDSYGREIKMVTIIQGESLDIRTQYDGYGRISQQQYPNGEFIYRQYNVRGFLAEVGLGETNASSDARPIWKALSYDASGRMKRELYGNDLVTEYEYDTATHMVGITTHRDGDDTLRQLRYRYDLADNLLSRQDLKQGVTEHFSYDPLDRLVQSTVASDNGDYQYRQNWDYYSNGNIRFNDKYGLGPFTYHPDKPHAVVKAGNHTYSYDANGNTITKDGRAIHWTSFNKPSRFETEHGSIMFKYGPDRSRYMKISANGDGALYLGKTYEVQTVNNVSTAKVFVYGAMGRLVAIVLKNMTTDSISNVSFIHTDNLGSVDTVTHANSTVVERLNYDAFGMRRSEKWMVGDTKSNYSVRGYTGHAHLQELGLVHMNGRVYDPEIGRFLSPDPHVQDPSNTQALNRYTYALNNPLKHSDPTGYFWKSLRRFVKKYWKPIAAAVVSAITFGAAAPIAAGLVAGMGISGVTAGVVSGALAGAVSGFAGGTVITGSVKGGIKAAAGGAIFGGVSGYFGGVWNLQRVTTQATAGGVVSELGGGKFKDGFAMAGLAASARYLYNSVVQYDVDARAGREALQKTTSQRPYAGRNNIGIQGQPPDASWVDKDQFLGVNWGEGGGVSRLLNRIPGVNAVAGLHDVFQVRMDTVLFPGARDYFNVPGMLPAAGITLVALRDGPGMSALLMDETRKHKR